MDSAITVNNLVKKSGKKIILDHITFEVHKGLSTGFIGPNGAGKSTAIKCLMNLINKDSGDIFINRVKLNRESFLYKKSFGYLPEENTVYFRGKIKDIFRLTLDFYPYYGNIKNPEIANYCEIFHIDMDEKFKNLSFGNKRKTLFVNELLKNPETLILDEPTNGLDISHRELFTEAILKLKEKGKTVFLSSHNLSDIENICDRIILIHHGKIIFQNTLEEFKTFLIHTFLFYAQNKILFKEKTDLLIYKYPFLHQFQDKFSFSGKDKTETQHTKSAIRGQTHGKYINIADFQSVLEKIFQHGLPGFINIYEENIPKGSVLHSNNKINNVHRNIIK